MLVTTRRGSLSLKRTVPGCIALQPGIRHLSPIVAGDTVQNSDNVSGADGGFRLDPSSAAHPGAVHIDKTKLPVGIRSTKHPVPEPTLRLPN
jgi:hypothetical protein